MLVLAGPVRAGDRIKLGIIGGSEELLWEKTRDIAAKDGLDITLVVFSDYLLPNAVLDVGDLDASAFQHKPFLDNQIKARGYRIVPVADTIVTPIGLYCRRVTSPAELKAGASIGIPAIPRMAGGRCCCSRPPS